jgi:hypothetical protein
MYILKPTRFFLEQITHLSSKSKGLISDKLRLIKINPFRYKRVKGYKLFLFRIRFEDKRKEKRIIYLVDKPYVKIICILDRDKEYKNLKKYLSKIS